MEEFFTATSLIEALQCQIKKGEKEHQAEGRGIRSVDYEIRIALPDTGPFENWVPVVIRGSHGLWITAYDFHGDLPDEVMADPVVSGQPVGSSEA